MQRAFHLDLNKCTGCEACVVACANENELPWGSSWRRVETYNEERHPGIPLFHLSLACNHCEDAPCQKHCPALAYSKDELTGAVVLDPNHCMGCKYCTWACPYDAPAFNPTAGVVEKCTFCNERQKEGHLPGCVAQCPTSALQLGELDRGGQWRPLQEFAEGLIPAATSHPGPAGATPQEGAPGFPRTQARPAIRFTQLREGRLSPAMAPDALSTGGIPLRRRSSARISLRSEWPLAAFTLLAAGLVGWMSARLAGPYLAWLGMQGHGAISARAYSAFMALALAGMGLSTLHLGQKSRAYRSILNLRHSWLSREIFFYSAFVALSLGTWLDLTLSAMTIWATVLTGFAALLSMDRVYHLTRAKNLWRHSAQVFLTGLLVFALIGSSAPLAAGILLLKLVLYLARKCARRNDEWAWFSQLTLLRVVGGIVLPAALWWWQGGEFSFFTVLLLALGEIVDRCEFYRELEVMTPRRQIEMDLARQMNRARPVRAVL
jgi:DMSO reductase iron-sulfur subunit